MNVCVCSQLPEPERQQRVFPEASAGLVNKTCMYVHVCVSMSELMFLSVAFVLRVDLYSKRSFRFPYRFRLFEITNGDPIDADDKILARELDHAIVVGQNLPPLRHGANTSLAFAACVYVHVCIFMRV